MSRELRIAHASTVGTPLRSRIVLALLLVVGAVIALYPMTARWFSQFDQSALVDAYGVEVDQSTEADRAEILAAAERYNAELAGGAAFDPFTQGIAGLDSPQYRDYLGQLEGVPSGVMARILIPAIEVDLPIYHGTTDEVLLEGVGHLFGTALPVGGLGTRATLTAHSGLADAVLFTFLDRLAPGDLIHIETYGERLSYSVVESVLIDPGETDRIAPIADRDLLTLVTCAPIGINSQRLIVTGERVATPAEAAGPVPAPGELPGFAWWAVLLAGAVVLAVGYVLLGGRRHGRHRAGPGDGPVEDSAL